jgi:hypothetical protein
VTPISLGIFASANTTVLTSYESIATVTVGSGGAANVEFTNIPSTYTHLQIRGISQTSSTTNTDSYIRLGYGGTYYATSYRHLLYGDGSGAAAVAASGEAYILFTTKSTSTSMFSADIIDILDYANTNKVKTIRGLDGRDVNGTGGQIAITSALWNYTNAVDRIELKPFNGSFAQYTHFALYGIKGPA